MKLTKLIDNFKEQHLTEKLVNMLNNREMLRSILPNLFPSKEVLELLTLVQPTTENKNLKEYSEAYLPLHTHDEKWLVKYVEHTLKKQNKKNVNTLKINRNDIESFVKYDPDFKDERKRYEEDLVIVEIENMLIDRKENDTSDYKTMQTYVKNSLSAEESFANMISNKMVNFFGLDKSNVNWAITVLSDRWLPKTMEITYINRYLRPLTSEKDNIPEPLYTEVLDKVLAQYEPWKLLRQEYWSDKYKDVVNTVYGKPQKRRGESNQKLQDAEKAWQKQYKNNMSPVWNLLYKKTPIITPSIEM